MPGCISIEAALIGSPRRTQSQRCSLHSICLRREVRPQRNGQFVQLQDAQCGLRKWMKNIGLVANFDTNALADLAVAAGLDAQRQDRGGELADLGAAAGQVQQRGDGALAEAGALAVLDAHDHRRILHGQLLLVCARPGAVHTQSEARLQLDAQEQRPLLGHGRAQCRADHPGLQQEGAAVDAPRPGREWQSRLWQGSTGWSIL
mmetsp:Transcript_92068/g.269396  ORF Transcript_92068/g.269396 Transcript_92068/m.269396 type:complete len:204 (-) Transcript_92068:437-1048(-)